MNVTSVRSTTRCCASPSSAVSSRRFEPGDVRERDLARHRDDGSPSEARHARRSSSSHTRWRSPRSVPQRSAHWSTRYRPQPPGPSGASIGRSGTSKPGPSSSTLRWTMSSASRSSTSTDPWADAGVADGVGDQLGGQQPQVLGRARTELVGHRLERGGDVAGGVQRRREALGNDPRRRDPQREAGDVVARLARGDLDRGPLQVLDDGERPLGGASRRPARPARARSAAGAVRRPRSRRPCRTRAGRRGRARP